MLIQNAVIDHTTNKIYKSWHRHDFVEFKCLDREFFIDGGNEYIRTNIIAYELESKPQYDISWLAIDEDDDIEDYIQKYVTMYNGENTFIRELPSEELISLLKRIKHKKLIEAVNILLSRKNSVLDEIVKDLKQSQ
jgi:hypothetical protein